MKRRGRQERWILSYTAMYIVCMAACMSLFWLHRKLPIYEIDGYMQHYTVLGYIRSAVREILSGNGFRMVDFRLGQGMDTLTTMGYHGLTDPLNLIAALFSPENLHWAYMLLAWIRVYLTGACLILYARKIGARNGWALSCAGIIYAFSGYAVYNTGWHTYFLNAMFMLPLMLLGVERILQDGRWAGFSVTVALMLVVSFYFAYVNTLVTILYIVVRLIARLRRRGVKESAKDGFALLGAYLLGAAMSAAVFLPELLVFFRNARLGESGGYSGSMLHYARNYYYQMLTNLFTPWRLVPHWTILGFAPLALAGLLALPWKKGRGKYQLMAGLLLCAAALCCPMAGKILCGGSYLNNRWCYAAGMFIAAAGAVALPELLKPKRRGLRLTVGLLLLAYGGGLLALWAIRGARRRIQLPGIGSVLALGLLVLAGNIRRLRLPETKNMARALSGLLVVSVLFNMFSLYGVINFYRKMMDRDIRETYASETAADRIDDGGVYRVEQPFYADSHAVLKDYMGTGFFWSLVPDSVSSYYRDLGNASQMYLDMVFDLGGGAAAETVAAVKYYLAPESAEEGGAPYGFSHRRDIDAGNGGRFALYENEYALPLGYAYDAAMTEAEYGALTVDGKQQALLSRAICDGTGLPDPAFEARATELEYRVREDSDVALDGSGMQVGRGDRLELAFAAPADSEVWLVFDGLSSTESARFYAITARGRAYGTITAPSSNYYFRREATALCLGGGEDALEGCTIEFDTASTYRFDRLRVVSLPLSAYREDVAARRAEGMTDVKLGKDRITGKIAVSGDRVLQIAVPYSDGWRAWVDGEEKPVFRCGGMYMGLEIGAGSHEIEMRYATPGLKAGAIISLAAALAAVALSILGRRRRRMAQQSASGEDEG